jgi:ribosomal protein L20
MSTSKKIFLASSSELKEDRQEFEIFINRKNKDLIKKGFFIELVIWEDFLDAMSRTRLQDEYNKAVRECDIFVMLFFTKVGKFTEEEFETAFGQFKTADKPLIYTYIKNAPIDSGSLDEQDTMSLFAFKKKLKNLGHFYTPYKSIDGLKYLFNRQLDKLLEDQWLDSGTEFPKKAQKTFNLPGSPDYFIGREPMLEKLHKKLAREKNLLLVNGLGGIGKTTAAQAYVNNKKFAGHYNCIAWVTISTDMPQDLINTLQSFLRIDLRQEVTPREQLRTIITQMRQMPGNNLLVLDNANNRGELVDLKEDLKAMGWHVLITSRSQPDDYQLLPVDELGGSDTRDLFLHHYFKGNDGIEHFKQYDLLDKLLDHINHHTLLIELLARAGRIKGITIAQMLDRLKQADIKHKDFQREITIGTHARISGEKQGKLHDYILTLFEPENLDDNSKHYLRFFAVLPAADIPLEHIKKMFGIAFDDENDFEDLLDKLQQDGWLNRKQDIQEQQIDISFKMHPLVQDVVKEKLKPGADNCFILIYSLSSIMKEHLTVAWHYISYAQSVTDQVKPIDVSLASLNVNLSDTYCNIGNLPRALATVEIAKKGFEDSGEEFKLSVCFERLGDIHQALGQLDKALEFFEMDIKLSKELYQANPKSERMKNGLAISYEKLGEIHQALGQLDQAREFFEMYNKLTKELYQANPKNVDIVDGLAISFYKLADIYRLKKQKNKANELFSKALNIWKQLFNSTNIKKYKDYIDTVQALIDTNDLESGTGKN